MGDEYEMALTSATQEEIIDLAGKFVIDIWKVIYLHYVEYLVNYRTINCRDMLQHATLTPSLPT